MNASQLHHNQPQIKLWPFSLIIIILFGIIIFLNGFSKQRDNVDLVCFAQFQHTKNSNNSEVKLWIKSDQNGAKIQYDYSSHGEVLGSLLLTGKLLHLDVSDLEYQFQFTKGKLVKDIQLKNLPSHLDGILVEGRKELFKNNQLLLTMTVTQMNIKKGYSIVQFKPSNNIWACKINN